MDIEKIRNLIIKMPPQKEYMEAISDPAKMYNIGQKDGWNNCIDHIMDNWEK